jgi:hypothetical protein
VKRETGGPAFPRPAIWLRDGNDGGNFCQDSGAEGMDLRDYFAGQVISQCQILDDGGEPAPTEMSQAHAARYARMAYILADAMLLERAK